MNINPCNGIWTIQRNPVVRLSSYCYLILLLQRSKEAISSFNKTQMESIIWDLIEIREYTPLFYSEHQLTIDSEIQTLERLIESLN